MIVGRDVFSFGVDVSKQLVFPFSALNNLRCFSLPGNRLERPAYDIGFLLRFNTVYVKNPREIAWLI